MKKNLGDTFSKWRNGGIYQIVMDIEQVRSGESVADLDELSALHELIQITNITDMYQSRYLLMVNVMYTELIV